MSLVRFLCVRCGQPVVQDGTVWVHSNDHSLACPPPSDRDDAA